VRLTPLLATGLALLAAAGARSAPEVARSAPRGEASLLIAGKRLAVSYGRPALRGREIFGVLVPWGEIWRTGADEATRLASEIDLRFGALSVPKGAYALFTVPGERGWQLVVNRVADQWGAFNYDASQDLGRVPMRMQLLSAPLERLSIALTAKGEAGGTLWIGWEKVVVSAEFEALPEIPPPAAPDPQPPQ
jgi:hypothetical protein